MSKLRKLVIIGFSDNTVKWLQSDLSNPKVSCKFRNFLPEILSALCGLQQRPIVSPLVFWIYLNDILMA